MDHRNDHHQFFCPTPKCQRVRRTLAQKRRRRQRSAEVNRGSDGARSRLQAEVKPTEADWYAQQPMFIGLISMLTGLTDLEDIKGVCRGLYERGRNILGHPCGRSFESLVE